MKRKLCLSEMRENRKREHHVGRRENDEKERKANGL
jgi:hypothetical protein